MTSPLERCLETAEAIRDAQAPARREWHVDERLIECGYGDWTGKPLKDLAKDPLWKVVQAQPSAVRFPGGESLTEMSARAVASVRDWDARLGDDAIWVACSHGDVIKAILADALGLHLDQFQRIVVDPCSVSVVRYTEDPAVRAAGQRHRRAISPRSCRPSDADAARREPTTRPSAAEPAAGRVLTPSDNARRAG